MDPASVIALVVAIVSAITSFASVWYTRHASRMDRLEQADQVALRFREPLLQAAFNLQSRLYNIVRGGLLLRLRADLTEDADREYVIENTLYLIGQYLCWVEILRRESQFIDPRNLRRNSDLAAMLESVRDTFAESEELTGPLRIFRGEQRAIAERMLVRAEPGSSTAPRWDAMGYASFIESRSNPEIDRWFVGLRRELIQMSDGGITNFDRMIRAQHVLVDLIDLIDPEHHRITSLLGRLPEPTTQNDKTHVRDGAARPGYPIG